MVLIRLGLCFILTPSYSLLYGVWAESDDDSEMWIDFLFIKGNSFLEEINLSVVFGLSVFVHSPSDYA